MPRVKLELPVEWPFQTELDVRIRDINYGQHLGNDAVLALLHEARLRFLAAYGFSEKDAGGAAMIMLDATIVYTAQAFHGDRLRAEVAAGEFGGSGGALFYRLIRISDGQEIARARTGLAFFNYTTNRLVRMPEAFRASLGAAPQTH